MAPSAHINQKLIVEEIVNAYESHPGKKKPLFHAVTFGHFAIEVRQGLENAGLPTFVYPDMLARVVGNVASYAGFRRMAASLAQERKAVESGLRQKRMPAAGLIAAASKQDASVCSNPKLIKCAVTTAFVCRPSGWPIQWTARLVLPTKSGIR